MVPSLTTGRCRSQTEKGDRAVSRATDTQGIALVRNLPPGDQSYAVLHTNYDMSILRVGKSAQRSASVSLAEAKRVEWQ